MRRSIRGSHTTTQRVPSRSALLGSTAVLALAAAMITPSVTFASPTAVGCSSESSEWLLRDIDEVAADFFPHLYASYPYADAAAFAADITALFDKDNDGLVCAKVSKGEDQNPKSHWYLQEIPLKGDADGGPVYFLRVRPNNTK